MKRGVFITFEGTEGAGKSTHLRLLAAHLKEAGHAVQELREPGSTELGEKIRHLLKHDLAGKAMAPETELLLFSASRAQLVREVIRPALAAGEVVLCDRFLDSTLAYQGYGRGIPLELIAAVTASAVGETIPDLSLLLNVSTKVSESRRSHRAGSDRFEQLGLDFFSRVEAGFKQIAAQNPDRVRWIEADRPVEAVQSDIRRMISKVLTPR